MSRLQLQDDLSRKRVAQKLRLCGSERSNVLAYFTVVNKFRTSSPIRLYKIRGILRANRALALVLQEPTPV
jgi:hypothetical protein